MTSTSSINSNNSSSVTIKKPTDRAMYCWNPGQLHPQPGAIYLDILARTLWAEYYDHDHTSSDVREGRLRRYPSPVLTDEGALEIMTRIQPLAQIVCDHTTIDLDHTAVLDDEACSAEQEITDILDRIQTYDSDLLLQVWDADSFLVPAVTRHEGDEDGTGCVEITLSPTCTLVITATTTDAELDRMADIILAEAEYNRIVLAHHDVVRNLKHLRNSAAA